MTPRKSASRWLPELDRSHDDLATTFDAKLTWLKTPDLEAGRKPDWLDMAVKVSRPSLEQTARARRRGRK